MIRARQLNLEETAISSTCVRLIARPVVQHTCSCDTTSLLFSIGKQSVFKVLKENPENFKDLSNLADCDVDVSVTGARSNKTV
jgi:hypothetical protein